MITVNGKKFAATDREATESLFADGGTAEGTYRVKGRAILLSNLQGNPIAAITRDGAIVTAFRGSRGEVRVMYGATEATERALGLPHSHGAQYHIAADALRQVHGTEFVPEFA